MKACLYLLVIVYILSCSKGNDNDPVYNQCLIKKSYTGSDTGYNEAVNFIYNPDDKLAAIDMPGPDPNSVINISFNGNIITAGNPDGYVKYYLRPDSFAYASATYILGSRGDSVLYEYDAAGYRIKEVYYSPFFGKDSTFLIYQNGDLKSFKRYHNNGDSSVASFEYTNDISKSWFYNNIGPVSNFGHYYPWMGKPNTHLIKNYSSNINIGPHTMNFSYTFNASGYVTKFRSTGVGSPYDTYFEYHCE